MYGIFHIRSVSVGLDSQIWYLFIYITGYLNVRKISETMDFRTFVGPLWITMLIAYFIGLFNTDLSLLTYAHKSSLCCVSSCALEMKCNGAPCLFSPLRPSSYNIYNTIYLLLYLLVRKCCTFQLKSEKMAATTTTK